MLCVFPLLIFLLQVVQGLRSLDELSSKYQIVYDDNSKIAEKDVEHYLKDEWPSNYTYEVIRYSEKDYLCVIPTLEYTLSLEKERLEENDLIFSGGFDPANNTLKNEKMRLVKKLQLIHRAYAKGIPCIYYVLGYWTYSFCFNNQINQFHPSQEDVIKNKIFKPDPNVPSYKLGMISTNFEMDNFELVKSNGNYDDDNLNTYISQFITDGTLCDITNKPRSTFIQYKCAKNSEYPKIEGIYEIRTCQYQIEISLPELCDDSFFESKRVQSYDIACNLIESGVNEKQKMENVNPGHAKINLVEYNLESFGNNLFRIDAKKASTGPSAFITSKITVTNEVLRNDIIQSFFSAIESHRLKLPKYIWLTLSPKLKNENIDQQSPLYKEQSSLMTITPKDNFVYVSKIFDLYGNFLDTFELQFNNGEAWVKFGKEPYEEEEQAEIKIKENKEYYGTGVGATEVVLGNFIVYNGVRYVGSLL
ncbi:hypothetical protein PACTADRAFT_75862 [Pachysolen tannophilus NRRL Y-2460]|uniref:Endoplasmic reticulum lectin n=1 Tax=Pachysolen tannophilus NRRL Y-2460 TaxID=669874 RepID=A0A1E4TUG8_PACTA|nr:hypothetical protein PACTADRAFT_75862 [Pachysolen tannophilus NRRL Y-2460]